MQVRLAAPADVDAVAELRRALWPDGSLSEHLAEVQAIVAGAPPSTLPLAILVADTGAELIGFAEVGLRSHADGCDTERPCGYLEGWYVVPAHQRRGVGRALVAAAAAWARDQGATELASDTWADHEQSILAHQALGFEIVDRCVNFRRSIADADSDAGAPAGAPALPLYGPALARIHHQHFGMVAEAAADELLARLSARGVHSGTVVDLAAGSGILSRRAVNAGFDAWGVDISPDMLAIARAEVPGATFVRGSLWDQALPPCVAAAAVGEAFCYRAGPDEEMSIDALSERLAAIRAALAPGGLLLFDVAGPGRGGAASDAGSAPASVAGRYWTLGEVSVGVNVHEDGERQRLTRTIDTFLPAGPSWRRSREQHWLQLYRPEDVEAALTRAGFAVELLCGYGSWRLSLGWHGFAAVRVD
ncbi:GNAT family N-acetyltransferase [Haliangium sp.]|uniref:GNAT family N-acetyltransferase n=1 Tax=Haliangium sp. TaxID=2663208 RepID=UPI003D0D9549